MQHQTAAPFRSVIMGARLTIGGQEKRRDTPSSLAQGFVLRKFARRAIGLSGLTAAGQASYLLALPLLSRLFSPADFGLFTVYLSVVNILAPIAGLRFELALFSTIDGNGARVIVRLVLTTLLVMTLIATGLVTFGSHRLGSESGHAIQTTLIFLPFGIFLRGLSDCATAWAIGSGSLRTLAIASFAQPFLLAVLQAVFGLMHLGATFLVLAYIGSYAAYAAVVFTRTMSREDVVGIFGAPLREIWRMARANIKFPLFTMPATLITLLISNMPPLLIGSLFGPDAAGQYGVAYRVAVGPITVICTPLNNIFTSEASRSSDPAVVRTAMRIVAAASLALVAIPILIFGLFAPYLAAFALGPHWHLAGNIAAALSVMAAAQALTSPFSDVTSIYRRQEVRLIVDALRFCLVCPPIVWTVYAGWDTLSTVRLMAAGGTVGFVINLAASLLILRGAVRRMKAPRADP
jgi:O-antigen/teichoic acid export membrane protein